MFGLNLFCRGRRQKPVASKTVEPQSQDEVLRLLQFIIQRQTQMVTSPEVLALQAAFNKFAADVNEKLATVHPPASLSDEDKAAITSLLDQIKTADAVLYPPEQTSAPKAANAA